MQPRASREGIERTADGRVRIRVNAPPVNDAANRRVVELLARAFGVPRSRVEILSGATARDKRLRIRDPARYPEWFGP